ncbi:MAG: DUF2442 domain-containing protein [Slackia sp.]|nr:DUF2442 domain-containing protein [Slackia sp.]
MNYLAEVIQALPGDDFTVYAYFSDGTIKHADIKPLIEKGGVFAQLADSGLFEKSLTVINHAVAWDIEGMRNPRTCIDIDPCSMYEECPTVKDPFSHVA